MIDAIVGGVRDIIFFLVVGFLGYHKIIGEPILAALLSAYTAHRFGVSMGKQQAIVSLGGGSGGTGSTGVGLSKETKIVSEDLHKSSARDYDDLMSAVGKI